LCINYVHSVEHVLNLYPNFTYIFCGDYNLLEVVWDNDDLGLTFSSFYSHAPSMPESFTAIFFQNNYKYNNYNKHGSLLDLVFSNVCTLSATLIKLTILILVLLFLNLIGCLLYQLLVWILLLIPCTMLFTSLFYVLFPCTYLVLQSDVHEKIKRNYIFK
jgi:hypothetical protein